VAVELRTLVLAVELRTLVLVVERTSVLVVELRTSVPGDLLELLQMAQRFDSIVGT
jgi:hypothetical protein